MRAALSGRSRDAVGPLLDRVALACLAAALVVVLLPPVVQLSDVTEGWGAAALTLLASGLLRRHRVREAARRPRAGRRSARRRTSWTSLASVVVAPTVVVLLLGGTTATTPVVGSLCAVAVLAVSAGALLTRRRTADLVEARREARTDELTGAANRRALTEELERRVARREPFSFALVDLDRFKQVNDHFGHETGDELLRQAVARLRAGVPERALVARLGGDELAVVLPEPDVTAAGLDLLQTHDALTRPYRVGARTVSVGASFGVAAYPAQAGSVTRVLRRADEAMYAAKASGGTVTTWGGRTRTVVLPEQPTTRRRACPHTHSHSHSH
ncbi:GGDEF domain-containing protein [Kineococcus gynurae]|uniref:GGDEF domain-containing protein n=1 Tax=Kineococcus gynurae TaxID=452979 RepID=A0ABV5LPP2_9ACTN